jgi:hypothetical protein
MTTRNGDTDGFDVQEQDLAARLEEQRPAPRAAFRGALGRYLAAHDPGYGPRPEGLRLMVTRYAGAGAFLIALGLLVAIGVF